MTIPELNLEEVPVPFNPVLLLETIHREVRLTVPSECFAVPGAARSEDSDASSGVACHNGQFALSVDTPAAASAACGEQANFDHRGRIVALESVRERRGSWGNRVPGPRRRAAGATCRRTVLATRNPSSPYAAYYTPRASGIASPPRHCPDCVGGQTSSSPGSASRSSSMAASGTDAKTTAARASSTTSTTGQRRSPPTWRATSIPPRVCRQQAGTSCASGSTSRRATSLTRSSRLSQSGEEPVHEQERRP